MSIWKKPATPEKLNLFVENTLIGHLGIKVTYIGEASITATMPVVDHNKQPMGFLHGGASVVLAESLGSMGAHLTCDENKVSFGIEVNANHLKSVRSGIVTAVATPLRLGSSSQVWDIRITSEEGDVICVSRLTVAIREL